MRNRIIGLLIKLTLIVIGVLGIVFTALSSKFMGGRAIFLFFTVQSNLMIIGICLVFLINDILVLCKKTGFINQILLLIKYVCTVAITITFIVFFTMLAPKLGADYLTSFNNLSLHLIVPVLAIADFFIFDTSIKLSKVKCLLGCVTPLYYVNFVYFGVMFNFRYGEDLKFPYFFLNYEINGFFFEKGMGVVIWIFILLVAIVLLCFLFYFLMNIRIKHSKKEAIDE